MNRIRFQYQQIKHYVNILKKDEGVSNWYYFYAVLKITFNLPLMFFYSMRLKSYKRKYRIRRPIVHCYATCWNEVRILPFMVDHYSKFVDQFVFYDNYSDDGTLDYLQSYSQAELIQFDTSGTYDEQKLVEIRNNAWKKSRGKADLVIVCDVDELLYHEHMDDYIARSLKAGVTIFKPEGYNMISPIFPNYTKNSGLADQVRQGWPDPDFNKCLLFNPQRIIEMNFTAGSHYCYPWGIVKFNSDNSLKLLHYKYLGKEYLISRYQMYKARYSKSNYKLELGAQYLQDVYAIETDFKEKLYKAKPVIRL